MEIGMTIATTSSSKLSDHRKGHVAIESTTTTPPQMNDFFDLLGTPYPPVSKIAHVK